MSDDQFTKLFQYMQNEFAGVNKKLDEKADKSDVDKIINIIDGYAAKLDTYCFRNGRYAAQN